MRNKERVSERERESRRRIDMRVSAAEVERVEVDVETIGGGRSRSDWLARYDICDRNELIVSH